MALSGSATKQVGAYWYLDLQWSATQNYDDNTSTVTAKLYWRSESPYSTSSSATKDGSITLGGVTSSFSGAGLASLSAGQNKLIHTYKRTISHSSTGELAIGISAVFNPEVTLSGTYYGSVSVSDGTQTLNTIPRESKLNDTTPNWTAGSDLTLSFTRYSSSFNHKLDIYLQDSAGTATMPSGASGWTGLKATHLKLINYSTSQTSLSSSFSTDEKYEIFQRLAGGTSIKAWIRLTTYSGSTRIGDPMDYFSTVTAPSASTTAVGNFTLGNTVSIPITRSDGEFKHEVKVAVGSWSKVLDADATTSYSWTSSTDKASILPQIPSTKTTATATFTITTYYYHSNGTSKQRVRSATTDTATVTIPSSESPTFTGAVTWADTGTVVLNGTTTSVNTLKGTGNELIMVQNKSKLVVTLPSTALGTAKAGTTMKQYTVTINGYTRTVAHPATATNLTFTFVQSELNVGTTQTMIVKAYDNRNLSTTVNKTVSFVPYSPPVIIGKAIRNNGFDNPSTVGASGTISPVSINSSNKNSIVSVKFQYKDKGASDTTYTTLEPLTLTTATFPAYKVLDKVDLNLLNTKSFTIKIIVTDKFSENWTTRDVAIGQPIMFLDSNKKSIGFGDFPTENDEVLIAKNLNFNASRFNSNGVGKIQLNKGNIFGMNAIFFHDTTTNSEGINFLRTGKPVNSPMFADYDTLRALDGIVYFNDNAIALDSSSALWTGGAFMTGSQTITPSKSLTQCPHGWMLVWSRYANGASVQGDWNVTFIPRMLGSNSGGQWHPMGGAGGAYMAKYLYAYNTYITGHDTNSTAPKNEMVLRAVYAF